MQVIAQLQSFLESELFTRIFIPASVSMLTAWLTTRWRFKMERKASLLQTLHARIEELRIDSELIARNVENHLTGNLPKLDRESLRASQIAIGLEMKAFDRKLHQLRSFMLTADFDALRAKFLNWKGELQSDGYPVQKKDGVFAQNSERVRLITSAQTEFTTYINELIVGCANHTIKYRKVTGSP